MQAHAPSATSGTSAASALTTAWRAEGLAAPCDASLLLGVPTRRGLHGRALHAKTRPLGRVPPTPRPSRHAYRRAKTGVGRRRRPHSRRGGRAGTQDSRLAACPTCVFTQCVAWAGSPSVRRHLRAAPAQRAARLTTAQSMRRGRVKRGVRSGDPRQGVFPTSRSRAALQGRSSSAQLKSPSNSAGRTRCIGPWQRRPWLPAPRPDRPGRCANRRRRACAIPHATPSVGPPLAAWAV